MPRSSKASLAAAEWLSATRVQAKPLENLAAYQKIDAAMAAFEMPLSDEQLAEIERIADLICTPDQIEALMKCSPRTHDRFDDIFVGQRLPWGRHIQVVVALVNAIDGRIFDNAQRARAAIKVMAETANYSSRPTRHRAQNHPPVQPIVPDLPATPSHGSEAFQIEGVGDEPANPALQHGEAPLVADPMGADELGAVPFPTMSVNAFEPRSWCDETLQPDNRRTNVEKDIVCPSTTESLKDRESGVRSISEPLSKATSGQNGLDVLLREHSALNPTWQPHEGAARIVGDPYPYFSGRGAKRLDPPPGLGEVRSGYGYRWYQNAEDGLWRDETSIERQARISQKETEFFAAFDDPHALPVANVVPSEVRGYVGPGQSILALLDLARSVRPCGPYQVPLFAPNKPKIEVFEGLPSSRFRIEEIDTLEPRRFEDFFDCIPIDLWSTQPVLRLRARTEPLLGDEWRRAPAIMRPAHVGFSGSPQVTIKNADAPSIVAGDPIYAFAAERIRRSLGKHRRLNTTTGTTLPDLIQDCCWVVSGPSGSGKTHALHELVKTLGVDTATSIFFLSPRSEKSDGYESYRLDRFDDLIAAAHSASHSDKRRVLIVDEYAEIRPYHLTAFDAFNQIVFFGDYSQGVSFELPVFDFVRRCGGGSSVLKTVWRSRNASLFDLIALLAYDGAYSSLATPSLLGQSTTRAVKVSFCPDDPQSEAVAMYCAAQRGVNTVRVTIVVDDDAAIDAINALAFDHVHPRHRNLSIMRSDDLRGHECDAIIVAAGALDRAELPTSVLLERLIVLLGRASDVIEFLLPESPIVGSSSRRFSCILQPLLSSRLISREPQASSYTGFAAALTDEGYELREMDDVLYVCGSNRYAVIQRGATPTIAEQAAKHKYWKLLVVPDRFFYQQYSDFRWDDDFKCLRDSLMSLRAQPWQ